jgi:hypothetical protein
MAKASFRIRVAKAAVGKKIRGAQKACEGSNPSARTMSSSRSYLGSQTPHGIGGPAETTGIRRGMLSSDTTVDRLFLQVHVHHFINRVSQKALPQTPELLSGIGDEEFQSRPCTPVLIRDSGGTETLS